MKASSELLSVRDSTVEAAPERRGISRVDVRLMNVVNDRTMMSRMKADFRLAQFLPQKDVAVKGKMENQPL